MKIIVIILAAAMILAGCADQSSSTENKDNGSKADITDDNSSNAQQDVSDPLNSKFYNVSEDIVDKDSKVIATIQRYGAAILTDHGLFYTALPEGVDDSQKLYEYHLFDTESKTDKVLATVENRTYEPGYVRTELGDCVYTLVLCGELLDDEPDKQVLYKFDLVKGTAEAVHSVEGRIMPYTALTSFGDKIVFCDIVMENEIWEYRVMEYDPATGNCTQKIVHTLGSDLHGAAIRQLCSEGDKLYALRLQYDGETVVNMFLDCYDKSYNKLSEKDLTTTVAAAALLEVPQEDVYNETCQPVNRLYVKDGKYVYYENFSITRFLADLETGELIFETNGMFAASNGSGEPFFFWQLGGDGTGETQGLNGIFTLKDGKVEKSLFEADDPKYQIMSASVSRNGSRTIEVTYTSPSDRNDTLPTKMYLFPANT
ncbi:MAG: hypothetical protein IKP47_08080 [Ruminococcus sp.]|nr:hypothetical protein [Ruminococcus sp.]